MAFSDWFRPKSRITPKERSLENYVERLITMRENMLREFKIEYPQLTEVLDEILRLEQAASEAMQAGNFAQAEQLNDRADIFEAKLKERVTPQEKNKWNVVRAKLKLIEHSLSGRFKK